MRNVCLAILALLLAVVSASAQTPVVTVNTDGSVTAIGQVTGNGVASSGTGGGQVSLSFGLDQAALASAISFQAPLNTGTLSTQIVLPNVLASGMTYTSGMWWSLSSQVPTATLTCCTGGAITVITIATAGVNLPTTPICIISAPPIGGTQATCTVSTTGSYPLFGVPTGTGSISFTPGSGYSSTSPPTVSFVLPGGGVNMQNLLFVPLTSNGLVVGGGATTPPTTLTGTVGTVPYFGSSGAVAASASLTTGILVKGSASGPAPSSITDNGVGIKVTEGAAPGGAGTTDVLWADSTAHRWKMSNNGGTAAQVVASGVDINTSDQVVNVNGVAYPSSPATGTAPLITATNTATYTRSLATTIPSSDTVSGPGAPSAFATTVSVPSTGLGIGSIVEIHAHGLLTTPSSGTSVMNLEIFAGGGTPAICPAGSTTLTIATSTAFSGTWDAVCYIQIDTTGTTGTASAWGNWVPYNAGGNLVGSYKTFPNNTTTLPTYNTSSAQTVSVQETATLITGQSFTLQSLFVKVAY